ncbi:MAG: hypothetical protein ATN32_00240 [Candidatus Epulonipiscium fishelsonii]|nr:MAG: hypothetical protein ATN32_00240 [Epulopiscium sp. AS2M-Bin002]
MTIKEIYESFDKIGSCTFATINGTYPETRIAHFLAYDEEGIYFSTMFTKPFYKQLIETKKVAVCGLCAETKVTEIDEENIYFEPGYFARINGDVKEVSIDELKAKDNPIFKYFIADKERYPAMVAFVLYRARGEIFDYDFEMENRENKVERVRFSYGGFSVEPAGLSITDKCINCGQCFNICSFKAIYKDDTKYSINGTRCDECGDCYLKCPVKAIIHKGE